VWQGACGSVQSVARWQCGECVRVWQDDMAHVGVRRVWQGGGSKSVAVRRWQGVAGWQVRQGGAAGSVWQGGSAEGVAGWQSADGSVSVRMVSQCRK
jgi:hypothetical protein